MDPWRWKTGELPHLATFVRAAELGSFSAAASGLGMTQPAVSQRIAALERALAVSLFVRSAGRITLSESGRLLYEYARKILDLHEQARQALGNQTPALAGNLTLSASSVPGECFLPALLPAFHAKYPEVHVRATVSDSGSVIRDVERGHSPLGLVGQKTESSILEVRAIGDDAIVLVVPPGHAWASRGAIPLKSLRREPLIVREPGSGSRFALEKSLEQSGTSLAELDVALELGSNAGIKDAVRRNLGVAFLSRVVVERELAAGELCAVTVRGLRLSRHFYLVYRRGRPLSPAANVFVRFIEAHPIG